MLLRLVPPAPLPTILFTLAFQPLGSNVPFPAGWDAQLRLLADLHLPAPPTFHALDSAAGWTALLESVTFDLVEMVVICIFIDGFREEWSIEESAQCIDMLEQVVQDVGRSAQEAEYEKDRDRESEREPEVIAPLPSPKAKKRKNLIMSLVASLVPPKSSPLPTPSSSPVATPPSLPPTPALLPPLPLPSGMLASRFLRRRARSTLVDTLRRFVLSPRGPIKYPLWIALSCLRRTEEGMARIIQQRHQDDEQEQDETSSCTDESSSVHTPLDHRPVPSVPELKKIARPRDTQALDSAYFSLQTIHHRMCEVVSFLSHQRDSSEEEEDEARAREVKSKRRAWSMGLLRGTGAGHLGWAAPLRTSPLRESFVPEPVYQPPLRRARSLWEDSPAPAHVLPPKAKEAEDVDDTGPFWLAGPRSSSDSARDSWIDCTEDEDADAGSVEFEMTRSGDGDMKLVEVLPSPRRAINPVVKALLDEEHRPVDVEVEVTPV